MTITRQRSESIASRMGGVLLVALIAILSLAPLPFGSVGRVPAGLLTSAALVLGSLWVIWRSLNGHSPLPWKHPILIWGALFTAFGLAQTIPIPRAALEALSPSAAAIRSEYEPPASLPPASLETGAAGSWRPISLDPWATRRSSLWFLACVVAALLASDLASERSGARALAAALVAGGGFQAIYGLVECLSGRDHIFGYTKEYYADVATGTFINRNHFAGYLEMTLPLAVALGVAMWARDEGADPIDRGASAAGRKAFFGSALILLALVMVTALLSSRSRMGIVSLALALMTLTVTLLRRGSGRALAATLSVLAAVTVLLFSQGAGGPILDRFLSSAEELQGGVGRWSIWTQAMKVSASFPLFGVGLGSFGSVFPLFRSTGEGTALAHAHSDVIELAVETGAAGTLLFVLGAALTFRSLARRSPDARPGPLGYAAAAGVLALTLHSLTDFNLAIPANALTFSVLAGLVLAWRRGTAPAPAARIDRAPGIAGGRPISAFAPAIALVLAAVAGAGGIVTATEAKGRTGFPIERILDAGDAGRIFSRASAAAAPALADLKVLTESAAAGSVPAKVTIDYVRKRIESALAIQESGLRCLPTSSSGHLERGRLLAALCSIDAITLEPSGACALRTANEFRAALRLNPMSASAHAQVARFYVTAWPALGGAMRIEAGTMIERAVELNPFDDRLRADWLAVKGEAPAGS